MTADARVALSLIVNGVARDIEVGAGETLLQTLRERLGLTGTKEGCVEGECGACTVLVDGRPVDSCILASASLEGREVRTVEGLSGGGPLGALQQAFVDYGAVQCGFCIPGFLMTLTALLDEDGSPSRSDVREALAGNLCRCTGYRQMLDAVAAVIGEGEES
jgi:carbon-monoxide dehydrogenase small subunit